MLKKILIILGAILAAILALLGLKKGRKSGTSVFQPIVRYGGQSNAGGKPFDIILAPGGNAVVTVEPSHPPSGMDTYEIKLSVRPQNAVTLNPDVLAFSTNTNTVAMSAKNVTVTWASDPNLTSPVTVTATEVSTKPRSASFTVKWP